jgi:Tol biopolymer transport system component/tRNA A-37 threonylcarbamoyl transferase component Bud32
MTPQRSSRIKEVWEAALEKPEQERPAFLDSACGGDAELRAEVEHLLAESHAARKLGPGDTLAHYRIESKLGEGGMGVVYKARDTRLRRFVAIKVLPPERVADPERKRRFIQEARSASALNHPHIVTIHDIGSENGADFIAMEYIEGKTLGQMIPPKGMAPREALNYAVQIADALAAAHAKGIVHRDVKPGNVMVTQSGVAKVLDFGLAKLSEWSPGEEVSTRTMSERTADGVVVGTVGYMSPEQAEGREVDARSDIFSLGVVLYQMLTGRQPFHGSSPLLTMAAILRDEPLPLASINPEVPSEVERMVARCLEKDPGQRFHNAADLKIVLEWLTRDAGAVKRGTAEPATRARRWKRAVGASLAAVLAAGAIAAAVYWLRQPAVAPLSNVVRVTANLGLTCTPALSPDGRLLAYASDRGSGGNLHIWVQQLPNGQPMQKTRDAADEASPRFSPDGSSIVFERTGAGIFAIPTLGDHERLIAPGGLSPQFSPDGTQITYWVGDPDSEVSSGAVFVTPFVQYAPKRLATEFVDARFPLWAPDGRHVLFQGVQFLQAQPEWWVVPIDGGPAVDTGVLAALRSRQVSPIPGPGDWKGNNLVFSAADPQSRHIWSLALKMPGWRLASPAERLTGGPGAEADPTLGPDGRIVFSIWNFHNNLWQLPLRGGEPTQANVERLSETGAVQSHPSISADGRTLAFLSGPTGDRQVWIRDLRLGTESELTFGPGDKSAASVAADGATVAYSVVENRGLSIYVVPATGSDSGVARKACEGCGEPSDWTHTGGKILCSGGQPQVVSLLDPASGAIVPILRHPVYDLDQPHISPDDQWIAFVARDDRNPTRIFMAPFRNGAAVDPGEWTPVTDGKAWDAKPRWLDDSSLIYYSDRDGFGCLWKQRLGPDKKPVGAPTAMHHFHRAAQSPRALFRENFQIAVTRNILILNLVDATGDIWMTDPPRRR